jgi:glutamate formiminotransferase/formiminotetrahydrofolate cyclodeaminase
MVECVPNFSEGRRLWVIKEIVNAIRRTPDVYLLDVSVGGSANRTVVTFIGSPEGVGEAAFKAIERAAELIDMRRHRGEHPRLGATDVCPFIPIKDVSMDECIKIAREVGRRVGEELGIPVYLYEYAATADYRMSLENIRNGEYESLPERIKDPMWNPDYGPCEWGERVARTGATIIGAREILIAYNINLNTRDRKVAQEIAKAVRESCLVKELPDRTRLEKPLKVVKAIGWYVEEYERSQVSINLTNYRLIPLWKVFETCSEEAEKLGVRVTGSEIIGLAPKDAILEAGRYYLRRQGKSDAVPEKDLIHAAILSLGLNDVSRFDPAKKILEYRIEEVLGAGRLVKMPLRDFMDELSRSTPVPGGGGVAALLGSLSASLSSMVAALTHGKKEYEEYNEDILRLGRMAQELKNRYLDLIEDDAKSFNEFMAAYKLPRRTEAEKVVRMQRIQEAARKATEVPMRVLESAENLVLMAEELVEKGNKNAISDVGIAAICAHGTAYAAYLNILVNLPWISDKDFIKSTKEIAEKRAADIAARSKQLLDRVIKLMNFSGKEHG